MCLYAFFPTFALRLRGSGTKQYMIWTFFYYKSFDMPIWPLGIFFSNCDNIPENIRVTCMVDNEGHWI